jgi:hypothetical protein
MPNSRKRKNNKTGKPVSYKTPTPLTLAAFNRRLRPLLTSETLNDGALRDAIDNLTYEEVKMVASSHYEDLEYWLDTFADRHPTDERWNEWRSYRRFETANAN